MPEVLVIDDEAAVRAVVRAVLEEEGYQVREAVDGEQGLAELRRRQPDAVLCDLFMPERDGLEVLDTVRQEFPGLPVVAMSGGGRDVPLDMLGVARALGAFATLDKPFSRDDLLRVVRAATTPASG